MVLSDGTEQPQQFIFMILLTLFGAAISGRVHLDMGDGSTDTRLYTILHGPSGSGKKSASMKRAINFFEEYVGDQGFIRLDGVNSAEGLARVVADQFNGKVVVTLDELKLLVDKASIQGSALLTIITQLFEESSYRSALKDPRQSVDIKNASLSFMACCTDLTYESMWTPESINIGLHNRFFITVGSEKPGVAVMPTLNKLRLAEIGSQIALRLKDLPSEPLRFTSEAERCWKEFYLRGLDRTSPHSKRLDTIGFRLMLNYAAMLGRSEIDLEIVGHVCELLKYEFEVRLLTAPIDAEGPVATMEEKIRNRCATKAHSKNQLWKGINAKRTGRWVFEQAFKNLLDHKELGSIPGPKTSILYVLSPLE